MTAAHPVPPSGSSPSSGSGLDARARRALAEAYRALHPEVPLDPQGCVPRLEDNLLPGVPVEIVRAALAAGAGQELDRKIRAVHSSAALVANCFGPWLREPGRFELAGRRGFATLELEFPCRIFDSSRATPAHLDLLARGPGGVVAVESKLTEHLKPPAPVFRPAYDRFLPAADPWSAWIPILRAEPGRFRWLDAAQLVKHAVGLRRAFPGEPVTLVYLYWEPRDAHAHPQLAEHREEVEALRRSVAGDAAVRLEGLRYGALWAAWADVEQPGWLAPHVARLRERYDVSSAAP
jgi:hypothetical protein